MKFRFAKADFTATLFAAVVVTGLLVGGIAGIADTQYDRASILANTVANTVAGKAEAQQTVTAKAKTRYGAQNA